MFAAGFLGIELEDAWKSVAQKNWLAAITDASDDGWTVYFCSFPRYSCLNALQDQVLVLGHAKIS